MCLFLGDRFLSSAGAGGNCARPMRLSDPSPVLDKNRAAMGPEILSSTGAGVWRKAPMVFPDSSSVLDTFSVCDFLPEDSLCWDSLCCKNEGGPSTNVWVHETGHLPGVLPPGSCFLLLRPWILRSLSSFLSLFFALVGTFKTLTSLN